MILLGLTLLLCAVSGVRAQPFEPSATTLTFSANPAVVGQPVTLTAMVSAGGGNVTGGLGVTFFDGADLLTTVEVEGGPTTGTATLTVPFSSVGAHTITAAFNGTSTVGASSTAPELTISFAQSTTTLSISPNPAPAGENVTLTATINANGGNVIGGLGVTFFDGPNLLSTVAVQGGPTTGTATLSVPFSTTGARTITAAFNGTTTVGASNSESTFTVGPPTDSRNLRAMQIIASRQAALNSGRAFTGAVESAIADGLAGQSRGTSVNSSGAHLSYGPESSAPSPKWPVKAPPAAVPMPQDWQAWADFRGVGVGEWGSGDNDDESLSGLQLNALFGVTRRIAPDLLVGVIGGYEGFDFHSDTLNADLNGDGWTIGGYVGGRIAGTVRFHAAVGYSRLGYDGSSGDADGSFNADRWIVAGGLAGDMAVAAFKVEPSMDIFGVWEDQDGYTDSLGTSQSARSFNTGRFSTGAKVSYPMEISGNIEIVPYAGLYADYVFDGDTDELADVGLAAGSLTSLLSDGWSARAVGGVATHFEGGGDFAIGAEIGGLGGDIQSWTLRTGVNVPF